MSKVFIDKNTITETINVLDDIKESIINKGVSVPENAHANQYGFFINSISGGDEPTIDSTFQISTQRISANGAYVIPDGVYSLFVQLVGGGEGGQGGESPFAGSTTVSGYSGRAGYSGQFVETRVSVTPGQVINAYVGGGGYGGSPSSGLGGAGGATTLVVGNISIVARGGSPNYYAGMAFPTGNFRAVRSSATTTGLAIEGQTAHTYVYGNWFGAGGAGGVGGTSGSASFITAGGYGAAGIQGVIRVTFLKSGRKPKSNPRSYKVVKNANSNTQMIGLKASNWGNRLYNQYPLSANAGNYGRGIAISPNGQWMAVVLSNSPRINIYKFVNDVWVKQADPAVLPTGEGNGVAFSSDSLEFTVAHASSPYLSIYKWTDGDVWLKQANPTTLPSSTGNGVAYSSDGQWLAVTHNSSPYITLYAKVDNMWTKLYNLATLPSSTGNGVSFSPNSQWMAVVHNNSPYVSIYRYISNTWLKQANPTTLPLSTGYGTAFSPDNLELTVAHSTSPFVTSYAFDGATWVKENNPSVLPDGTGFSVSYSPDGLWKAVGHNNAPFFKIYKFTNNNWVGYNPNTVSVLTGVCYGVAFHPISDYTVLPMLALVFKGSPNAYVFSTNFEPVFKPVSSWDSVVDAMYNEPLYEGMIVAKQNYIKGDIATEEYVIDAGNYDKLLVKV